MTFTEIVLTLCEKAGDPEVRSDAASFRNFDNVIKISKSLQDPIPAFLYGAKLNQLMSRWPKDKESIRDIFKSEVNSINDHLKKSINPLTESIYTVLTKKWTAENDTMLLESYGNWKKNLPDANNIRIARGILVKEKSYAKKVHEDFNANISQVLRLRLKVKNDINSGNLIYDNFFKTLNPQQEAKHIAELTNIARSVLPQQQLLINALEALQPILEVYDRQRAEWADIIIGMKQSPNEERKPVQRVTSIKGMHTKSFSSADKKQKGKK